MEGREPYHWKAAISTGVCFVGGLIVVGSGDTLCSVEIAILCGLLLIGFSVAAFILTEGWQHAGDLSVGKKIIAYTPVVLGGVLVFAAYFILRLAWRAFVEAAEEY